MEQELLLYTWLDHKKMLKKYVTNSYNCYHKVMGTERIDSAFTWSNTPEGHTKWQRLNEEWNELQYDLLPNTERVL